MFSAAIVIAALLLRPSRDDKGYLPVPASTSSASTMTTPTVIPTVTPSVAPAVTPSVAPSVSLSPTTEPSKVQPALRLFCADGKTTPPTWLIRFKNNDECSQGVEIFKQSLGADFDMSCCSCGLTPGECKFGETVLTSLTAASCQANAEIFSQATGSRFSC